MHWTLCVMRHTCFSLKLLLAHDAAVEYWERGRLRTVPAAQAPSPETVLTRLLHTHRRPFQRAAAPIATTLKATRCGSITV
ncbi:hypothetical protein [Cupriavidus sp. IK-TO18]|uniref:hypothetical protein n=1 Tax=Cupriavidus sp. IK-TO18 TaxID=2782182 RepID=UPI001898DD4C|nr:hypothetical protein [Cupriavidus sp. IK-TO18]MBF6989582.1 hypothetical protein [Cupriavidus sp. IK-TO18]